MCNLVHFRIVFVYLLFGKYNMLNKYVFQRCWLIIFYECYNSDRARAPHTPLQNYPRKKDALNWLLFAHTHVCVCEHEVLFLAYFVDNILSARCLLPWPQTSSAVRLTSKWGEFRNSPQLALTYVWQLHTCITLTDFVCLSVLRRLLL